MAQDPDSRDHMADPALPPPRCLAHVDDLSGVEDFTSTRQLTEAARERLDFAAAVYLLFLKANEVALDIVDAELDLRLARH